MKLVGRCVRVREWENGYDQDTLYKCMIFSKNKQWENVTGMP